MGRPVQTDDYPIHEDRVLRLALIEQRHEQAPTRQYRQPAVAQQQAPDRVVDHRMIVDIDMPPVTGFETLQDIRRNYLHFRRPAMFPTVRQTPGSVHRAKALAGRPS